MIGEIVETTTLGFRAGSQELHRPPALGELVKVRHQGRDHWYAVVLYSTTGAEAGRHVVRRATPDVRDEAIYRENPQLQRLLHTLFEARLVGWREEDRLWQTVPPLPPPLHYSVYSCTAEEVADFSERLHYFRLLVDPPPPLPAEQVLAAHIRHVYVRRGYDDEWLTRAAREVASLLKEDHARLLSLLYAIDPER
ncbi:MAG: hypothetical protein Q9O62_08320 [Ardenticatenia bacterium]|nr:hypothetical protein [Ardenticatenia bacterium]